MSPLSQWNVRQIHVLQRFCSVHRIPLTPEVVVSLATRYAAKHAGERPSARTGSRADPGHTAARR